MRPSAPLLNVKSARSSLELARCSTVAVINLSPWRRVTRFRQPAADAAKTATATISVVFHTATDPVRTGLVASLSRPGGNLTGISFLASELVAKRLELLREVVPASARALVLLDPASAVTTEATLRDVEPGARAIGLQIQALYAITSREIDAAFATFVRERPDALFVAASSFFVSRRILLANLATLHRVPASYSARDYAEADGLMSYGSDPTDSYRQLGAYAGRILKGAKPADLPVVQSSKFELVINAQTARMLGLAVPDRLLAIADEVIE
jgi:putative tryptophan/tyrosine transport system substrate-binding protein